MLPVYVLAAGCEIHRFYQKIIHQYKDKSVYLHNHKGERVDPNLLNFHLLFPAGHSVWSVNQKHLLHPAQVFTGSLLITWLANSGSANTVSYTHLT
ncbi:MAG: hypothetical protein QUS12_12860, partial [Methanosarcina sp.]|nr:hypothetical protein [Methanosarcina sp.]